SLKSHESKIRARPHKPVHDPAKVRVPAYHPDTPEVRRDWAQYYDVVSEADADAGARLKELAEAGLADDTIVFYFADHGSGMPRRRSRSCTASAAAWTSATTWSAASPTAVTSTSAITCRT